MAEIYSPIAKELLTEMLKLLSSNTKESRFLKAWDGYMDRHKTAPTIFMNWLWELNIKLYSDALKELTPSYLGLQLIFVKLTLTSQQSWCDNVKTPQKEDCSVIVTQALDRATKRLGKKYEEEINN